MRIGLCSVSFRALNPDQVISLAANAGLESIEWGGDIHVPPGCAGIAAEIARRASDEGLVSCSYGSYFRASEGEDFDAILDSAQALGATRVRVWAGDVGSEVADACHFARVADRLHRAAESATSRGISLALEFHGGTLADTPASTLRLLEAIGHPSFSTYWQPSIGVADSIAMAEYRALAHKVSAAHVFSWWPTTQRLRLSDRAGLWKEFFTECASSDNPPSDALLEFFVDDDPALLAGEAAAIRGFRDEGRRTLSSAS